MIQDSGPVKMAMPVGRVIRLVVATAVLVVVLVLVGRQLSGEEQALEHLRQADPGVLLAMVLALFACMVVNGMVTRDLVGRFAVRLRASEWMGITLVASMLNLVTPLRGGAAVRALYLKQKHSLPYAKFASTMAAMLAFGLAANATLGLVCILLLGVPGGAYGWMALLVCAFANVALVLALLFARPVAVKRPGIMAKIGHIAHAWHEIAQDGVLTFRLALWSSLNAVLHALAFVLAFHSVGFAGSWLAAAISSAFAKMSTVIAITPAGLGIYEAFGVVSARVFGADLASSILAVLVVRLVSVAISVTGGVVMWPFLLSTKPKSLKKPEA